VSRFSFNRPGSLIAFLQKSRSSFFVMFSAISGMIFCMAKLHLVMYNVIITFVLLGLYSVPVMPFKQLHFTRRAGVVKTILLSFTWAFVTILIPLQIPVFQMNKAGVLLFINRFLFMLMLCIIFDKRDAAVDKIRGLHSLATAIKPRSLHYFMAFILLCYIGATLQMTFYGVGAWHIAALIIAGLIAQWIYVLSLQKRGYLFYYFVVDGLMFLSAIFTGIVTVLKQTGE
jgi:4-hydroxybenzoate polyprenyltransferase